MKNELFKNKYRIKSIRLKDWDYSSNGGYFITICTKNMKCFFGDVIDGKMELSPIGKIVEDEWIKTGQIRPYVQLDTYCVMPNHIHGIILIDNPVETPRWGVSTIKSCNPHHKPQWKPHSLGSIMNQYKSICTKHIWSIGYHHFFWQERYYEHIIRNETNLNRIRKYIIENPLKWKSDRNNSNKIK